MGVVSAIKAALYNFVVWTGAMNVLVIVLRPVMKRVLDRPIVSFANHEVVDAKGRAISLCVLDGKIYPPVGIDHLRKTANLRVRPDDVMLCGFPKTGCHWVFEILSMLVNREAKLSRHGKVLGGMFEAIPTIIIDSLPSPRVLNTHFLYDRLPTEAKARKTKIILTTRNPKDTAVSFYNHHLNFKYYLYKGEFVDFFPLFMDGKLDYGDYFDYWLDWERAIKEHTDHPILVIPYEELKADTVQCVLKMAKFLEIPTTKNFAKETVEACEFHKMKARRAAENPSTTHIFRKGKVGDWRRWLTEDQSKAIDRRWEQKMKNCLYQPEM